jgi:hypothetical protein
MRLFKKGFIFLSIGIRTTTLLFAYDNKEKRISELEKQMLEVGSYHPGGVFGSRFASASPINSDWEVGIEALLWQAKVGGTEYACSVENLRPSTGNSFPLSGTISEISFDLDWGFKCQIGKQNIYEGCDLLLSYTRYFTSSRDGYRKDLPSGFFGLTGFLNPALTAKSHYKLHYQNVDAEFGKANFVSKQLLFRGYIGLKSSWIDQIQKSYYAFDVNYADLASFSSYLKDTANFWAIGPKLGMLSRWYLCREFSLMSKVAGALLYGYYRVQDLYETQESRLIQQETETSFGKVDLKGSSHHFCPFVEMALGLSWNKAYLQDKIVMTLNLSYDMLYFSRQKETLTGEGFVNTGGVPTLLNASVIHFTKTVEDLGFHGVSFSVEVDF